MSESWGERVTRRVPLALGGEMFKRDETPELLAARREARKSCVRVVVTYLAALFVFVGGPVIILAFGAGWVKAETSGDMKEVFMTVLPIATGILTYWFADRAANKARSEGEQTTTPVRTTPDAEIPG